MNRPYITRPNDDLLHMKSLHKVGFVWHSAQDYQTLIL